MADHGRIWFSFNAGKWSSTSEPWFLQGLWNPRRGITLALLLLRLTGTCMVSFGVHTVPLCVLRKQKGGDHWNSIINGFGVGKIKRSHLLPPQVATPQTAAATIAMKPLLTWVSLLKFQKLWASKSVRILSGTRNSVSANLRSQSFLVFGTKLWATTRLFGSVFPASTWMGLYLASSCPGNSGNRRVRQSSH